MKKQNTKTLGALYIYIYISILYATSGIHLLDIISYKNINKKVSLLNKISFIMLKKNQIKENIKIGYYIMRNYIRKKNLISLSFL